MRQRSVRPASPPMFWSRSRVAGNATTATSDSARPAISTCRRRGLKRTMAATAVTSAAMAPPRDPLRSKPATSKPAAASKPARGSRREVVAASPPASAMAATMAAANVFGSPSAPAKRYSAGAPLSTTGGRSTSRSSTSPTATDRAAPATRAASRMRSWRLVTAVAATTGKTAAASSQARASVVASLQLAAQPTESTSQARNGKTTNVERQFRDTSERRAPRRLRTASQVSGTSTAKTFSTAPTTGRYAPKRSTSQTATRGVR